MEVSIHAVDKDLEEDLKKESVYDKWLSKSEFLEAEAVGDKA